MHSARCAVLLIRLVAGRSLLRCSSLRSLAGGYVYLRASLPQLDGDRRRSPGISAPVDIVRDADAIPHVFAATKARRALRPRLRARAGSPVADGVSAPHRPRPAVESSARRRCRRIAFSARVGFGRAARSRVGRACRPTRRQQINAYVAGVNAFIATHHGAQLPPEFTLLRFEPEPWTGPDVLVWVKMMAWDLSANYSFELLRHDLAAARRRRADGAADAALPGRRPEHSQRPRHAVG